MAQEIEAKFLDVSHDVIREKLTQLGAHLEQPMRLMRRTIFDYPDKRLEATHRRLRVRDEGDKITVTFKAHEGDSKYPVEIETRVESYEAMCELFEAAGLEGYSRQESKRETWVYKDVEVVLDEWPWVKPFIEIEGPSEDSIRQVASELGFDWNDAYFGAAETVYCAEYPSMKDTETIGEVAELTFSGELPEWLAVRRS